MVNKWHPTISVKALQETESTDPNQSPDLPQSFFVSTTAKLQSYLRRLILCLWSCSYQLPHSQDSTTVNARNITFNHYRQRLYWNKEDNSARNQEIIKACILTIAVSTYSSLLYDMQQYFFCEIYFTLKCLKCYKLKKTNFNLFSTTVA